MHMLRILSIPLILVCSTGCLFTFTKPEEPPLPAFPEKKWNKGESPPATLPSGLRYPILSVGSSGDYVVLEDPLRLTEGHGGTVYRNNKAVGRIRMTGSRNGSATAADITAGSAQKGDQWGPDPH